jgi:dTDP-4-dehydrorhamnose 3,5-epimerase
MRITHTTLSGVWLLEPIVFGDSRGYFIESYNKRRFHELGIGFDLLQDNESVSLDAGTLRGLHYQLDPMGQTKVVRVLSGAIYDVAVDIRKSSSTYGEWLGFVLTAENKRQLVVPRGFAHGICTLVPNTKILYKVDNYYSSQHDRGIIWNDAELKIDWPVSEPILSDKDREQPTLANAENNFQ